MDRPGTIADGLPAPTGEGTAAGWDPATLVGVAVAIPVAVAAVMRVSVNAPIALPGAVRAAYPAVDAAVLLAAGFGALVLGLTARSSAGRVGLVAVGVFALLAAVVPPAAIPASGVVVVGAGAVAVDRLDRPVPPTGRTVVSAGYVLAMGAALGAATGLATAGFRAVGAWAALGALAALSTVHRPTRPGWLLAGLAFAGVLVAGVVSPFLTGAVVLIAAGVIGAPLVLVAAGVGGAVAAGCGAWAAGRRRAALGAVILLAAGVPATLPRAAAAVVGLALVLELTPAGVAE